MQSGRPHQEEVAMGQSLKGYRDRGSIAVSPEANEVLTEEEICTLFDRHASGDGMKMVRLLNETDLTQRLLIRSVHETDEGDKIVVMSEFLFGITTMDLEPTVKGTGF
jgi:hypothetical protein